MSNGLQVLNMYVNLLGNVGVATDYNTCLVISFIKTITLHCCHYFLSTLKLVEVDVLMVDVVEVEVRPSEVISDDWRDGSVSPPHSITGLKLTRGL